MADRAPLASAIRAAPDAARWSLRCRPGEVDAVGAALGFALPDAMCQSNRLGARAALRLGPDEWQLRTAPDDRAWVDAIAPAVAGRPFSLVDISDRQVGFLLAEPGAADILAAGCPLDFDSQALPTGMCTRTVFAKAEVLLWRREDDILVEVWRSFAGYLAGLLAQAELDAAW